MSDADMTAMREMGEWLLGANSETGYRNLALDCDRSYLEPILVTAMQECMPQGIGVFESRAHSIAEAWAAVRARIAELRGQP